MTHMPVGIDLGTSTSVITVLRDGIPAAIVDPESAPASPIVPSIAALDHEEGLVVGRDAVPFIDEPGWGVREVKRLMGTDQIVSLRGSDYRPEEISAAILRHMRRIGEQELHQPITDAVITVPANFPELARSATYNAASIAGLNVLQLVNEPTSAALAFGVSNLEAEEQLVVFDFGGGTLDVTVLEMMFGVMDVRSSFGDTQLGGKNFDDVLINLLGRKFLAEGGRVESAESFGRLVKSRAENAKKQLGRIESVLVELDQKIEVEVRREEFLRSAAPLFERARGVLTKALSDGKFKPSAITKVLLVGGTTYMPAVRELVEDFFQMEADASVNPDLAVALGACVRAGQMTDQFDGSLVIADAIPFSLGVRTLDDDAVPPRLRYDELIPKNERVPSERTRQFQLIRPDQDQVDLVILQDNVGGIHLADDATVIASGHLKDIPPSSSGIPHSLTIRFAYNLDGRLDVEAYLTDYPEHRIEFKGRPDLRRMSESEVADARQRLQAIQTAYPAREQAPLATRHAKLLDRARNLSEKARPEMTKRLEAARQALIQAIKKGDEDASKEAARILIDVIFDAENQT